MNVQAEFTRVIKFIYAHRDGEVAENITKSGGNYNMNYGLSSLLIKNEARRIGTSQELALKLWKENTRETRLMALYLFDPQKCDIQFINDLVNQFPGTEIALQASMSLLQNAGIELSDIVRWCKDDAMPVKLTGYNTLVRKIKSGNFAGESFGIFFEMLGGEIEKQNTLPLQSVSIALETIARAGEANREEVIRFVEKVSARDMKTTRFLVVNVLEVIRSI